MRRLIGPAVVAAACLASLAGCAQSPSQRPVKLGPVDTAAGSVESTRRQLAGNWILGSLEVVQPDGARQVVKARGTLSYDTFGSLIINGVVDDPRVTDPIVLNYTGRIVMDVTKHEFYPEDFESNKPVETSRIAPVSLDKVRRYELSDDKFVVTYLDAAGKPTAVSTWNRASR